MTTLDDYRLWLREQKYTPSTIDASIRVLQRLDHEKPEPANVVDEWLLRRYLRYVKETRHNPLGKQFTTTLEDLGLTPVMPRAMSGKRKRKLLTATQFNELKDQCLKSSNKPSILVAYYMISGKKPHDFLKQPSGRCSFSAVFMVKRDIPIYEILSPSFTWAYRILLSAAKREARALDIDADLDTIYRSRLNML